MRTALYRHFDSSGSLLYVGISLSAVHRLSQHKQTAHWFEQIANVTIEWLPSREAALAAEAIAIARERPANNIQRPAADVLDGLQPSDYVDVEEWEENEVLLTGESLSLEWWRGVQWSVTEYGIEARDGNYVIEAGRVRDQDWPEHMAEKVWINYPDFVRALVYARELHFRERVKSFRGWMCAHSLSGHFDGMYRQKSDAQDQVAWFSKRYPGHRFVLVGVPEWIPMLQRCFHLARTQNLAPGSEKRWQSVVRDSHLGPRRIEEAA